MKYEFVCEDCDQTQTVELRPSQFDECRESGVPCECSEEAKAYHQFNPGNLSVCFKGDGWSDKMHREKKYRSKRSQRMAERQRKHNKTPELVPNYQGEEVENWREAQNLASKDGRSAATYEPKIHKD